MENRYNHSIENSSKLQPENHRNRGHIDTSNTYSLINMLKFHFFVNMREKRKMKPPK